MQNNYIKNGEGGIIMAEQVLIQFRADTATVRVLDAIFATVLRRFRLYYPI